MHCVTKLLRSLNDTKPTEHRIVNGAVYVGFVSLTLSIQRHQCFTSDSPLLHLAVVQEVHFIHVTEYVCELGS